MHAPLALRISNIQSLCCSVLQCRLHVPYYKILQNIVCCICVLMAHRLVTSLMTSRDDSMTSYSWSHNLQKRRIRKLGHGSTIRMDRHYCQCQSLKWPPAL